MTECSGSLQLRDVRYGFPDRRDFLGPVTLAVQPGQCWGIVGPNGAGKSTLLRIMSGLLPPIAGDVWLDGRALHQYSLRERARKMALVPQTILGDDDLTVRETVLMGRYPHRSLGLFESTEDQRVADRVQLLTETTSFSARTLGTLSGGEAQRVHLASALAQEPDILLLDEPTASLDLRHQINIFELLRGTAHRRSLGVVVVTHDVNLASRFCTNVVVLHDGKVAGLGAPDAVLTPELLGGVFDVPMVRARDPESAMDWLRPVDGEARMTTTRSRYWWPVGGSAAFLLFLLAASPGVGTESSRYGWQDVWRSRLGWGLSAHASTGHGVVDLDDDGTVTEAERSDFSQTARVIFDQRMPRTLLALQVGITLALCGATFQILFRNPLATPYTLGVASGGSLGAMIAIKLGWVVSLGGISSLAVAAFGGAWIVVGVVMLIAVGVQRLTSNELLLAGVTMGLFCSAMMMLVTSVSNQRQTFAMVRWMMGSLDAVEMVAGTRMLPLMVPAWVAVLLVSRALNQYRLGDEIAIMRGVSIRRLQLVCVGVCTLAVAAAVGQCGPIGFVGLVVPHMARLVVGADCRILLPVSALLGGAFLILCDWASQITMRTVGWMTGQQLGSATLPIGVVTALVGVPLFLVLLRTRRR